MRDPNFQIRNTMARWCLLGDEGRFDDWVDDFEPDGRFVVDGVEHHGRAAIRAVAPAWWGPEPVRHLCTNTLLEVDDFGGTAQGWTDVVRVDAVGRPLWVARFTDEIVRGGDERWRFALREVVAVGAPPVVGALVPG